jgi:hypothetical protein
MANLSITDLPVVTTPNQSDIIPYINIATSTTCKITLNDAIKAAGALPAKASNYIYVPSSNNALTNGTSLLDAYTTGKTLTPGGSALSSTNRVSIILDPGNYNLGSSSLTLDTQYIDIIGLTKEASHVTITSSNGTSTIIQTANDVRSIGYTIKNTGGAGGWKPSNNLTLTYLENIIFTVDQISSNIILSGTFKNCKATNSVNNGGGFVGSYGIASGTFIDCTGTNTGTNGGGFVGYSGTASGTFTNCTGSNTGASGGGFVGQFGVASGTFTNCSGTNTNTGINGGGFAGREGIASGIFINCSGSNTASSGGVFTGWSGIISGTFTNCIGTNTGEAGGGFVGPGTVSGTFINCTGTNTGAYGGGFAGQSSTVLGTFINCTGTNTNVTGGGFLGYLSYARARFINCISTDLTLPTLTNSGDATKPACYINCFDGSGNLVNGSA